MLAVDAFFSPMCSPYATPATIALALKQYGSAYRSCYSWLGPNQPGVNETDPSDPSAPVPDPGGAPPGETGPSTDAARLTAAMIEGAESHPAKQAAKSSKTTSAGANPLPNANPTAPVSGATGTVKKVVSGVTGGGGSPPPINLGQTLGQVLSGTVGAAGVGNNTGAGSGTPAPNSTSSSGSSSSGSQAQQLLNYLLAP